MVTKDQLLQKIQTDKKEAPLGAFATELSSNADVVGNLNSQHMYNQTVEKDEGLQKMAENKYLEKIASLGRDMVVRKSWGKRLYENVAHAEPLTQLGLAAGAAFSLSRLANMAGEAGQRKEYKKNAASSLRALQNVNKNIKGLNTSG